jgi:N,N'-diacetyllegionaminate synthase
MFVIAEAGVNHNGDPSIAHRLIDAAKACGANAIKFQTFVVDRLVSRDAATAAYQKAATGVDNQREMLAALELSPEDYVSLAEHCYAAGIEFMSTPFAEEEADFLVSRVKVKRLKIASGELTNLPLLRYVAGLAVPTILSTGMADLDEVRTGVEAFSTASRLVGRSNALPDRLSLLHCTSVYPTQPEDVNLRAIMTLQASFKLPVGYSDHTDDIAVAIAAAALGSTIIEKHFTLDRSMAGPDHAASLEPPAFADMVRRLRQVCVALGDGIKSPRPAEIPIRAVVRRSVAARQELPAGTILERGHLCLLRPGDGFPPAEIDGLMGRRLARNVASHTLLRPDDLSD